MNTPEPLQGTSTLPLYGVADGRKEFQSVPDSEWIFLERALHRRQNLGQLGSPFTEKTGKGMIFQINCFVQKSGSFVLVLQKDLKVRKDSVKDMRYCGRTRLEKLVEERGKLETVLIINFWGGVAPFSASTTLTERVGKRTLSKKRII